MVRAHRIAPWYARVLIVQAGIGAGFTSAAELPAVDTAGESRPFRGPLGDPRGVMLVTRRYEE